MFDKFDRDDKWQLLAGALGQAIVFFSVTVLPEQPIILLIALGITLAAAYKYMFWKFTLIKSKTPPTSVVKAEAMKHLSFAIMASAAVNIVLSVIWGYDKIILSQPGIWSQVLQYFSLPSGLGLIIGILTAIGNDLRGKT